MSRNPTLAELPPHLRDMCIASAAARGIPLVLEHDPGSPHALPARKKTAHEITLERTGGKRRVAGKMNGIETAWAAELDRWIAAGTITTYVFEGLTLRLAEQWRYTVDFVVRLPDGRYAAYECKGFMHAKARGKLKMAAEQFSWLIAEWHLVRRDHKRWVVKRYEHTGHVVGRRSP